MQKAALILFILFLLLPFGLCAQTDSGQSVPVSAISKNTFTKAPLDSLFLAKQQHYRDSLKQIADSLTMVWIKAPNPDRPNLFVDSLVKSYQIYNLDFQTWAKKFIKRTDQEGQGKLKKRGESWIIFTVLLLILTFALLKNIFPKEISLIFNTFYNQKVLSQIPNGGQLFSTWSFISLNLLFGFTIGMFLFLAGRFFNSPHTVDGLKWYLMLSGLIILLFALKITVLRFLGYILEVQRIVKIYVSMLYVVYFFSAILFLPLVFSFSLTSVAKSGILLYAGMVMVALIIAYQLVRVSINMLSQSPFPKSYLFIYLCALEICPILVLIKVLRF